MVEMDDNSHPSAKEWFQALSRHQGAGAMAVRQWWNSSPQDVKQWLLIVAKALYYLGRVDVTEYIRLA
ncbi:hypothetical protein MXD81_25455, partial [Microbacteriaceae bacterium K1510]|nr:hypothetical protein [Microbacteriaceae bacterium K1510]